MAGQGVYSLDVLRLQGLVRGTWTLAHERLSAGQGEAIARFASRATGLDDDGFVAAHLDDWLR